MVHHLLTSHLAAHGGIHQAEAVVKADAAGTAVDRAVGSLWAMLLKVIKAHKHYRETKHQSALILHAIQSTILDQLRGKLANLADWAHTRAVDQLTRTLPLEYLQAAVLTPIREDVELTAGGGRIDRAQDLREPVFKELSKEAQKRRYAELLFPPPEKTAVDKTLAQILPSQEWLSGVGDQERRNAEDLAHTIAVGKSQGKSDRQIAQEIRPYVDGSRTRATRAARTFGIYVAGQQQLAAAEKLGDLVAGYQVHSAGGENARHDHALRSGTIYWKNPPEGEPGLDVMPHPPVDRGGPHEDEEGIRWNCRCWLTPVLRPPEHITSDPERMAVFANARAQLVPDPSVYSDWWRKASIPQQKAAVGAGRWHAAAFQGLPKWEDFLDPITGKLLTVKQIESETKKEKAERVEKVKAVIADRKRKIEQVAVHGFIPPTVQAPARGKPKPKPKH